jgi:hypothetical protein
MKSEVSLFRLYLLRAMYLLIFVMVPQLSWTKILDPSRSWGAGDGEGFTVCMLGAFSVLCGLGLRYPLKMLPLLFWELVWKMIWMVRVALPLWQAGKADEALIENSFAIGLGALLFLIIPWRYVIDHYWRRPGDPWRVQRDCYN